MAVLSKNVLDKLRTFIFGTEPILTRWEQCIAFLTEEKLVSEEPIKCTLVLCSPANRSKLGLNAFEAHRTGKKVVDIGFSMEELRGAVCIEMDPDSSKNADQIAFNVKLVKLSDGMLAAIDGGEKYLSVGGGHMVAFLRAIIECCKTSEPTLADEQGNLNKQKLLRDPILRQILEKGYTWLVISWKVSRDCQEFADFAQRALNATNSIASECSELEVMSGISEFADFQRKDKTDPDWDKCSAAAISGNPRSAPYVKVLTEYVQKYGGGVGAPVVHDLDAFAKQHSQNLVLGQDFMENVVNMKLGETTPCPRFRAGCLATNLTSAKSIDGISKLLTKSDLGKFQTKGQLPVVLQLEDDFTSTETLARQLVASKTISQSVARDLCFLFMIRSVAHLAGKGMQTYMKTTYKVQAEITDLFYEEINKVTGIDTKETKPTADESKASNAIPKSHQPSLDEVSDPVYIAGQKGFAVDKVVYERALGPKMLFVVTEIKKDVALKLCNVLPTEVKSVTEMDLATFLKDWGVFKGDVPLLVPDKVVAARAMEDGAAVSADEAKVGLFQAMLDYQRSHAVDHAAMLYHCMHPTAVYAKKQIAADKLKLVPLVPLGNISISTTGTGLDSNNVVTIEKKKMGIFISKPQLVASSDLQKSDAVGYVQPFFWVTGSKKTENKKLVNMGTYIQHHKGYNFPVLRNTTEIPADGQLLMIEPQKTKHSAVELKEISTKQLAKKHRKS